MLASISNTGLEIIIAGALSGTLAQLIKVATYMILHKSINFRRFVQTGGMPSSHSSSMTALATSVGLISGFTSVDFAIAFGLAMVVMYDAAGLRQAAGKMAGILNRMAEDFYKHHPGHIPDRIRELLGHTPFEVFVGALFGITLSVILHQWFISMA